MNTTANQNHETNAPQSRSLPFSAATRAAWLSTAVICLMAATMAALLWFPLKRTFTNVEVNYNEGWNAYRAEMVAKGVPLYGTPPKGFGTATAYPPISFHVVGWLGSSNTFLTIGRCVSLLGLLATGVFVGLIVKQAGGSGTAAVFSFLLYEIGIVLLRADRVGMYDPQLLGEALSAAGLYFYVRNPDSRRLLFVSALFFCLGGFTKHNLLAFPAAVAIDALFRSRKSLFTWAGAMVLCAGLLMAATLLIDGRYFPLHLMGGGGGGRSYSYMIAWSQFHHFAEKYQALMVIAVAWAIGRFRSRLVIVAAFVLSLGLASLLAGGYGVDMNIFFNALAATVMVCGVALSDVSAALSESRTDAWPAAPIMFGLFFVSILIYVPGQLRRDRQQRRLLPVQEKEFNDSVEFLKSRPGPALCESHLLCYESGKPFEYEPFSVRNQMRTGGIPEEDVLQLLRTRHFQTVEIALRSDEEKLNDSDLRASLSADQTDLDKERRFTPNFMRELLEDYQLAKRTPQMAIYVAK
jgi:hypothetical protein